VRAPGAHFILQPVAAARARHDGQTARPRPVDPIEVGAHHPSLSACYVSGGETISLGTISRGRASTSTPRSRRILTRWFPSTIVPSGRAFKASGFPGNSDSSNSRVDALAYASNFAQFNDRSLWSGVKGGGIGLSPAPDVESNRLEFVFFFFRQYFLSDE